MNETIADAVEELCGALEWTDEANALGGEVDCGWTEDDTRGWLMMGSVEVEWLRDPYGDGLEDRVAVNVTVGGEPFDTDGYSHLSDVVKDAAHTAAAWQHYCDQIIHDEIVDWLDGRGEYYDDPGPRDEHESWVIQWGPVEVRGAYDENDGAFVWSVTNSESGDYLDGDASDNVVAVIDAMEQCAADPMEEAWVEAVAVLTAEDEWAVRSSADQMTVWRYSASAYGTGRRAYYEPTGYETGRIELEYRVRGSEWRAFDEYLPEDEGDVREMAAKAYAWVRSIDD